MKMSKISSTESVSPSSAFFMCIIFKIQQCVTSNISVLPESSNYMYLGIHEFLVSHGNHEQFDCTEC